MTQILATETEQARAVLEHVTKSAQVPDGPSSWSEAECCHSSKKNLLFSLPIPRNQVGLIKEWLCLVRLPPFLEVTVTNLKKSHGRENHGRS